MTTKFKFTALFLGALFFYRCGAVQDSKLPEHERGGVVTVSNTALRITPLVFSGIITRLERGNVVEVMDRSAEKSNIARTSDYWYYVKLQDGTTGWIYGQNLRLMDLKNYKQLDNLLAEFKEFEAGGFAKAIAGRWWSVNAHGNFTEHALDLYEDNKYKSYFKGQEKKPIEGEYRVDFNKSDIIFPRGTTFKHNLKFAQRGDSYILYAQALEQEMSFKRIQEGEESVFEQQERERLEQQRELERLEQQQELEKLGKDVDEANMNKDAPE